MLAAEKISMNTFAKCPTCGGPVAEKAVEKIVRGGNNTAILHVTADVCTHCGERMYSVETVRRFEHIRDQLARDDVKELLPVGHSYELARSA